ncbi:unannotated protein [freshwater metagenome]|uniref:Unannotated protein n=1 Tax=freshwater metagenome TaxID=449393 RepID=A0A6J6SHN1_9ZZZZ
MHERHLGGDLIGVTAIADPERQASFTIDPEGVSGTLGEREATEQHLTTLVRRRWKDIGVDGQRAGQCEVIGRIVYDNRVADIDELLLHRMIAGHAARDDLFDEAGAVRMLISVNEADDLDVRRVGVLDADVEGDLRTRRDAHLVGVAGDRGRGHRYSTPLMMLANH